MFDVRPEPTRRRGVLHAFQPLRWVPLLLVCSIGCGEGDQVEEDAPSTLTAQAEVACDTPDAGAGDASTQPADYQPCPAAPEPCKILPLGDSITLGVGFNGGYRVELFRKALAAKKKITFTGSMSNGPATVDGVAFPKNHEGRPAWKIGQLLPIIPSPAMQQKPHIVLLMAGTNDVARPANVANAPNQLGELIDKISANAPDALIVVANLIPMTFSDVRSFNAAIPAVVAARAAAGKHVKLVDMFTGFSTSMLGDGVHPNQQGYARMATVWYDAIGPVLR